MAFEVVQVLLSHSSFEKAFFSLGAFPPFHAFPRKSKLQVGYLHWFEDSNFEVTSSSSTIYSPLSFFPLGQKHFSLLG
jgi:hypothetical protein